MIEEYEGGDQQNVRTQHCECGSEEYHIKWTGFGDEKWAECADCGRPTATLGDGMKKQMEWMDRTRVEGPRRIPRSPRVVLCWLTYHKWVSNGLFSYRCERCGAVEHAYRVNYDN